MGKTSLGLEDRSARLLSGRDVWTEIKALLYGYNDVQAAIAFVGADADQYLPLRGPATIVVNAGDEALHNGWTDPAVLLRWTRRGVRVHSMSSMHAKLLVANGSPTFVLVGSADVLSTSGRPLEEAVLVADEKETVDEVREAVSRWTRIAGEPLTDAWLQSAGSRYRPSMPSRTTSAPAEPLPAAFSRQASSGARALQMSPAGAGASFPPAPATQLSRLNTGPPSSVAPAPRETVSPVLRESGAPVTQGSAEPVLHERSAPLDPGQLSETIAPLDQTPAPLDKTLAPLDETPGTVQEHSAVLQKFPVVLQEVPAPLQGRSAGLQELRVPLQEHSATVRETREPQLENHGALQESPVPPQEHSSTVRETHAPVEERSAMLQEAPGPLHEDTGVPALPESVVPALAERSAPPGSAAVESGTVGHTTSQATPAVSSPDVAAAPPGRQPTPVDGSGIGADQVSPPSDPGPAGREATDVPSVGAARQPVAWPRPKFIYLATLTKDGRASATALEQLDALQEDRRVPSADGGAPVVEVEMFWWDAPARSPGKNTTYREGWHVVPISVPASGRPAVLSPVHSPGQVVHSFTEYVGGPARTYYYLLRHSGGAPTTFRKLREALMAVGEKPTYDHAYMMQHKVAAILDLWPEILYTV